MNMDNKRYRLLTAQEAKEIDINARRCFGISTLVLMENAGISVAEEAKKILTPKKGRVAIFCGRGNNGADGFVIARQLLACGIKSDVFLVGMIYELENEAKTNLDILLSLKVKIVETKKQVLHLIRNRISKYHLIIDALLGVGLKGQVRGIYQDLIDIMNSSKAYVLSVDVPSGLDTATGRALGCCVKADKTVTFVAKKRGMVIGEGPKYCGKIIVRSLGIPL